jgi:c(7)-type cytochrome triheme protein
VGTQAAHDLKYLILFLPLILFAACSDKTLNLFFDIPVPTPEELAAEAREEAEAEARAAAEAAAAAGIVPAVEEDLTWQKAEELLPKDEMEEIDWMAALRQEIIRPRSTIDGRGPEPFVFKFDFYLPGPDPMFDAYFPHSSHTQWLGCESCHPAIFPKRGTEMTMDQIMAGEFCGVCHGRIAFALDSCARCHTAMAE